MSKQTKPSRAKSTASKQVKRKSSTTSKRKANHSHHRVILFAAAAAVSALGAFSLFGIADSLGPGGCRFNKSPVEWTLTSDCSESRQIRVDRSVVVNGNGYTVKAEFTGTGPTNNSVFAVVGTDNVTFKDINIDGQDKAGLNGVYVYGSDNVGLDNVKLMNNSLSGLFVEGADVWVNDISTSGDGQYGVKVEEGVSDPAVLTVTGLSQHTNTYHVYVGDKNSDVTVNDVENQYIELNPGLEGRDDALYMLKTALVASDVDQCKKDGWKTWFTLAGQPFKNQGQCVSYIQANERSVRN